MSLSEDSHHTGDSSEFKQTQNLNMQEIQEEDPVKKQINFDRTSALVAAGLKISQDRKEL